MTSFATAIERTQMLAQQLKELERNSMTPALIATRDGRPIAVSAHDEIGELLGLAPLAASGYGADSLALVFEGVLPLIPMNPLTGAKWGRGEAEQVWLQHDGVSHGWVIECQMVAAVSRLLELSSTARPFLSTPEGITWREARTLNGTGVESALAHAFELPILDPAQVPDPGDRLMAPDGAPFMDAERGRMSLDIGLTRTLDNRITMATANGGAMFICGTDHDAELYEAEGLMASQCFVYHPLVEIDEAR